MEEKRIAPVIRNKIIRAVREGLDEAWEDPFWAQLDEADDDSRAPLIDVQDHPEHYTLVVEMPGIPKENVNVNVREYAVDISGENVLACELGAEDLAYLCNERTRTSFHRRIPLPKPVVPDGAEASMDDGVLVITLPKVSLTDDGPSVSLKVE